MHPLIANQATDQRWKCHQEDNYCLYYHE